jgi:hypothetical protein
VGLFVTLLAVAALVGSLAWGVWGYFHPAPVRPAGEAAAPVERPSGRVRVQVLNATATHGLARRATDLLRDRGFDVLETGNAPRGTGSVSIVYDRTGTLEQARQVADALRITRYETRRDAGLMLDVTVVLGDDWRPPPAPRAALP